MNRKRLLIFICFLLVTVSIEALIWLTYDAISSITPDTNFNIESLKWSIIGAIGGWVGSLFGFIALLISILALWLPQQVRIAASISCGMMLSQVSEVGKIDAYIITVKNMGMKPLTIKNVYLNFGGKRGKELFVGTLNQCSPLQLYTPTFPKRLDQGESFDYYLLRDRLIDGLLNNLGEMPRDTPFLIRVSEVTKGDLYFKTKWTLGSFIGRS